MFVKIPFHQGYDKKNYASFAIDILELWSSKSFIFSFSRAAAFLSAVYLMDISLLVFTNMPWLRQSNFSLKHLFLQHDLHNVYKQVDL